MIPKELEPYVESTPDTLGGALRFKGTRIHVQILFDYVLTGETLQEFFENYPDVSDEAARAVMEWERARLQGGLFMEKAS
jgi:uncharacterized protein (DUF433 family)